MALATFTKSPDKKGLWFQTDYNPDWIYDIKDKIPPNQRAWDPKSRLWWVSKAYAKVMFNLCNQYFGGCRHRPDKKVPASPTPGTAKTRNDEFRVDDPAFADLLDGLDDLNDRIWENRKGSRRSSGRQNQGFYSDLGGGGRSNNRGRNQGNRRRSPGGNQGGGNRRRQPPPPRANARGGLASAYRTLHLDVDAPWELVKSAHKALARVHHPDRGGNLETMQNINVAFDLIRKSLGK